MRRHVRGLIEVLLLASLLMSIWQLIRVRKQRAHKMPNIQQQHQISPMAQPSPQPSDELNPITFKERLRATFPSIYTTLISIIQGVAISILSLQTVNYITEYNKLYWFGFLPYWVLQYIPFSFSLFLLIVIVTFEYTWYTALFRYEPKFLDITIPLGLGFFEILPMYYLTIPAAFSLSIGLMCFNAALAYWYSLHNLPAIDKCYIEAQNKLTEYYRGNIKIIVLSGFLFGLFAVLFNFYGNSCCVQGTRGYSLEEFGVFFLFLFLEVYVVIRSLRLYSSLGDIFHHPLDPLGLEFLWNRKEEKSKEGRRETDG